MVYHEITAGWSSCLIGRGAARDGGSIAAPPPRIGPLGLLDSLAAPARSPSPSDPETHQRRSLSHGGLRRLSSAIDAAEFVDSM